MNRQTYLELPVVVDATFATNRVAVATDRSPEVSVLTTRDALDESLTSS